jgi:enoyl-CoA hydratase/carnithine racemase
MAYEQIVYEQHDDVVVITLNRPEKLNAWTPLMSLELEQAIEAADADRSVGAVVLTGAGRGFCAGADISAVFDAQLHGDAAASTPLATRDWIELIRSTKPIVAAVNGAAIGVGLTMILPFDRIVCAQHAKLSVRFVKMALVPELASSIFLPARCGFGGASDLMLSGRTVEGDEALAMGLVDEVDGADTLLNTAIARARSYGENAPGALHAIKELLTQNMSETNTLAAQEREGRRLIEAYQSPEHREAVAAFLEKRAAVYR